MRIRALLLAWAGLAGAALAGFWLHAGLGIGGASVDWLFNDVVYNGLMASAAAACLLRAALVPAERLPWLMMGLGLSSWLLGELYWMVALGDLDSPPFPSPADALYLGLYPCAYASLGLLVRMRVRDFRHSLWLDGVIAALAVSALAAAVAFQPIVDATEGSAAAVVTNLAYPIGDLVLLGMVVTVFGISGWRPGRAWILIGLGLTVMAIGDGIFLVQAAEGSYVEGTLLDALWPTAVLLVGLAAWQPATAGPAPRLETARVVVIPFASALTALALLVLDHFERLNAAALALTAATLFFVTVRMAIIFVENQRVLARSRREALTDALTGLSNRRALMDDLHGTLPLVAPGDPHALILFDLNGFKHYNDTFGHPAGDALLARLGRSFDAAIRAHGRAYRLGGDEFCALVRPPAAGLERVEAAATAALSEHGVGFSVTTASGAAICPTEATDPTEMLQLADRRMYARKGGRSSSATRQTRDVLLRTLYERRPGMREHPTAIAQLALEVGRRLEMAPEGLDELARAAELHDIGKMAIPDAILDKREPLDEDEQTFMRRHTIIGERILGAAPALRPVGRLVRSSHERWDGRGYPDGLAGEEIPLGARVVAVCDAYHALTEGRRGREPMSTDAALDELRRGAGSQFDPSVVEAFAEALSAAPAKPS